MNRLMERCRELSTRTGLRVLGVSAGALLVESFAVCVLGFGPGWANGWPGASKHVVFASTMSGVLFVMLVTAGAGLLAISCALLQRLISRDFVGWSAFAALLLVWMAVAALIAARVFPALRAYIAEEWP